MVHVRTKRKPTAKSIGKVIFSLLIVFSLLSILVSLGNYTKNIKMNFSKGLDFINVHTIAASKVKDNSPWVLDNESLLFTPRQDQIFVQIAKTETEREIGLSGREELRKYDQDGKVVTEGMLFVFDKEGTLNFWMKDMSFDLDMIWLNKDFKVVHMEENVRASSYIAKDPTLSKNYSNRDSLAQYVLEINSGLAKEMNLKIGDTLRMQ